MPPANMQPGARPKLSVETGRLDMTYDSGAGQAAWRTCRDEKGRLMPYSYDVTLVGTDARGDAMRLDLHVTPSRAPVPLGAAAYNGKIECFGQDGHVLLLPNPHGHDRHSALGIFEEKVTGTAGHVDRQWFPLVANDGGATW